MISNIKRLFMIISGLCILNFNVEAKPLINFGLSLQGLEQLNEYSNYRKCAGLKEACLYDLPIVTKGTVVSDQLSPSDIENIRNNLGDSVFCRFDAPSHKWYGLPRGQGIRVEDINNVLCKVKK